MLSPSLPSRVFTCLMAVAVCAHSLGGLVASPDRVPLQGVEVRASWTSVFDSTDADGAWFIDDATGIVKSERVEWRWSGNRVFVDLDVPARLAFDAFDASGRSLWSFDAVASAGRNIVETPHDGRAVVLRIRSSSGATRLLRHGGPGFAGEGAARTADGLRVLSFRKSGYKEVLREVIGMPDTLYTVLERLPDTTGKVARVEVSPDTGVHATLLQISFSCATPGVVFFYTLDSSAPAWDTTTFVPANAKTKSWTVGSNPIYIQRSVWLRVAAARRGMTPSDTLTGRYVYIGDSALIDDFELTGLGSKFGPSGMSWFACQFMNGSGCDQDQKYRREATLPLLDTTAPDYLGSLGKRAWRVQVSMNQKGEYDHPAYVGCAIRVPSEYTSNAYRLVFRAKFQDTGSYSRVSKLPFVVEAEVLDNAQNNGGYQDGFHRKVLTVGSTWKRFEIDFYQFYSAGNGYASVTMQPESTATNPKSPALFYLDNSMHALGLSGYQGQVSHNAFQPAWTWGVSKDVALNKSRITGFRFSVIQPMDSATASTVGGATTHDPREPALTAAQLAALVKDIAGYLWIDDIRLVRKSI